MTVDTVAPIVTIDSIAPGDFRVTASEAGARVECRLDGGLWAACEGSVSYPAAAPGGHLLEAQATDAAGNVGPVARGEWTITPQVVPAATPPAVQLPEPKPVLALTVARQRLATVLRSGFAVGLTCTRECMATLVLAYGKRVVARRTVNARSARVVLRLTRLALRRLVRAKRVTLTLTASASGARTVTKRIVLSR